jgi:hypothetical protein
LPLGLPGLFLLFEVAAKLPEIYDYVSRIRGGAETLVAAGCVLLIIGLAILAWGMTKRRPTEMAVTNRRVPIKTGLGNRRTLDLMLSRVEASPYPWLRDQPTDLSSVRRPLCRKTNGLWHTLARRTVGNIVRER